MKKKDFQGFAFQFLSSMAGIITVVILIAIFGRITLGALPSLTPYFILTPESKSPGFGGGIANAIVGTIILSVFSTIIATPLAVGSAVYFRKYAKEGILVRTLSFAIDILSGTPSIVMGIFALYILVFLLRAVTGGFSLISGSIALAMLILPVIEKTSEKALERVPCELEEASYALGATKWQTIKRVTLPYALTGIATGIILGAGRAAEESAVVILSAGYTQFFPELKVLANEKLIFGVKIYPFQDLIAALPITVYHGFEFPALIPESEIFATAFVLIVIVMLLNLITRFLVWRRRIG